MGHSNEAQMDLVSPERFSCLARMWNLPPGLTDPGQGQLSRSRPHSTTFEAIAMLKPGEMHQQTLL